VLALGGGAARAAAHIGVLSALRRSGRSVAGIAGTSAGALIGAMALLGLDEEAILAKFADFMHTSTYREMRRRYVVYRRGAKTPRSTVAYFRASGQAILSDAELAAFDDDLFEAFIESFVGPDRDMSSLERPFAIAATDLVTGRSIHIAHGPLHQALRASCALPGLFRPQRDGERLLVDGSTIAEVPVRAALGLGVADALGNPVPVVAVHLARPERIVASFATSAEVVFRSGNIVHKELVREQLRHANHLITAHVEDIGWIDFRRARETAEIGEREASAHLESRQG
jgi:NTE family protein